MDLRINIMPMYDNLLANVPTDLWIGGKWRKASDGARFDVIDPATENKDARVRCARGRAAQACGCRRAGDAVEFPRRDGDAQDRSRARGRLPGRAQAGE